jgi:hypothetical protein
MVCGIVALVFTESFEDSKVLRKPSLKRPGRRSSGDVLDIPKHTWQRPIKILESLAKTP